ncbi:nuclear pore glycoprotein p62 [Oncorhynchus kisutch]|uniref:Nuclear pore glycoprotein p62 n=1 Tax=Oncorhynchus kisutch TaxID=8019 RepID=A0A8C7I2N5_ONCKI|nr:nuclear pore glycoprotein p62-like [Oncorhynchus kisutch]XP_031664172.1 nuclear pore glycoprotein p62-like [Oncorhynchus kisutch]
MSGGFNFGQASNTGFSFGAPKTTAAPATGFGIASAAPTTSGGGFSFGPPNPAQPPNSTNSTGGFSFGNPTQNSTPAGGGFSIGTPTAKLNLGTPAASQPALTGITMGMATPTSGAGFGLGGGFTTQTTAVPTGGGFSFGTAGGLGAPVAQTPAQPAAAGGLSLGTPAATTQMMGGGFSFGAAKVQAAPTVTAGGGFSFGNSAPATLSLGNQSTGLNSVAPASRAAPTTTQGGGFAFGGKPSATPAPAVTASATQASLGSSLFAVPASTTAVTGFLGAAPTSAAPAATSAAGNTLGFMLKPLGAVTATTTASAGTGFSLGMKPAGATGIGSTVPITGIATTITTVTASAPPVMSYTQLEGLINKWSLELEDQERHFLQQATQVNAWDRTLVENGEKITSLHREMEKVKLDQRRLDQELDFILSQQKELEDLLSPLEESVKEQSGTIYMQNADEERERTYKLAENVDAQLKRMSQDLKEIIEHLNTSCGPADTSDPLQQICKILNAHMDSLQWIDQNSVLLQRRVEDVSKLCDNRHKEQEKTLRITFG